MGKLGQLDPILLAEKTLVMTALFDIVDLDGFVAFRGHEKLARVVEVERQHVRLRPTILDIISLE